MQNEPKWPRFGDRMRVFLRPLVLFAALPMLFVTVTRADVPPDVVRKLTESVSPSLVAVQYTWEYEFGKLDFVGAGVVVSDDGLVMLPLPVITPAFPDAQLTDFKIIIPHFDKDDEELEAVFQGRDER